jgi:uncharacterized damage-inducible protein DinB
VADGPRWFDRRFLFDLPLELAPNLLERLRGTPARLRERLRDVPKGVLTRRDGDAWSVQEQVGHLLVLEPLWSGRIDDVLAGAERLRAADLTNAATFDADFNSGDLAPILYAFTQARASLVARLEALDGEEWGISALHPRLEQPMRILDLVEFVAEHDDHHLVAITGLVKRVGGGV